MSSPKIQEPNSLIDFRTINLYNIIYNVVFKVLINLINPLLHKFMCTSKKGFVMDTWWKRKCKKKKTVIENLESDQTIAIKTLSREVHCAVVAD